MARPKRQFTDNEIRLITRYALNGGKNNTIAMALGMPVNTLTNRFSKLLKKARAKRKLKLAGYQTKQAKNSADMAKFLGINELGQVAKQTVITEQPTESKSKSPKELEAVKAAAKAYNEAMSRADEPKIVQIKDKTG